MALEITEQQVSDLVASLRSDSNDSKLVHLNTIKSNIKQQNVADASVPTLFEALRMASSSQHAIIVNAGFTALCHLITRISHQEPRFLIKEAPHTLLLLIDKMGDQKEKLRMMALLAVVTFWKVASPDAERAVRNTAMSGKNPRAKETAMQWLLLMHRDHGLQFRSYVPVLMELLEDADSIVRDTAKSTVIELFRNAPNAAKADLKRQLKNFKVRSAIEQAIIKGLAPPAAADRAATPVERQNLSASVPSSYASERPITPITDGRPDVLDPIYVNTQRELDDMFKEMHLYFDGRETEQNWLKREESMTKLRRLIAGNAVTDFQDPFIAALRSMLDGMIKAIISLRTSLCKEGCALVQDIAKVYGPAMDPMVELLMQTLIKLSAATKKISSQLANSTVDTIIGRVSYTPRLMQHLWGACQDKNVQPRSYATGWLKTLLAKEGHYKSHVEHSGGLDLIEKCIKKGLADTNPSVREKMRSTYWTLAAIWPARAEAIMDNLDVQAQKLLRNSPSNPNNASKTATDKIPRPGLSLSRSTTAASKSSVLRDIVSTHRKANVPSRPQSSRPESAMAHFVPSTAQSSGSTTTTMTTTLGAPVRPRNEAAQAATASSRGLSVAPVRPARKKAEIARPATAGPYSVRSHDRACGSVSPESLRSKMASPANSVASPRRALLSRSRSGHISTASESSIPTPPRVSGSLKHAAAASPGRSPLKPQSLTSPRSLLATPSRVHEDFSLIAPPKLAGFHSSPLPKENTLPSRIPTLSPRPATGLAAAHVKTPPPLSPPPPPTATTTATTTPTDNITSSILKVYEDPSSENSPATPNPSFTGPVLEDKPVNADAGNAARSPTDMHGGLNGVFSPEKAKQNTRLLDSGIAKIQAKSLDVHGFRKLQSIIRESKTAFGRDKFDALLLGLFDFLEAPPHATTIAPEKQQDVKAQILATIRLLIKKMPALFPPHVLAGLASLLRARAAHAAHSHIVAGLELLVDELVTLSADPSAILSALSRLLHDDLASAAASPTATGSSDPVAISRGLTMGLHILKELIDRQMTFLPDGGETAALTDLAARCLDSPDSAVRMDAVHLCVALHARVGDARFWDAIMARGVKEDPKSLITYYVVKEQREREAAAAAATAA